jgi:hypothetical protein
MPAVQGAGARTRRPRNHAPGFSECLVPSMIALGEILQLAQRHCSLVPSASQPPHRSRLIIRSGWCAVVSYCAEASCSRSGIVSGKHSRRVGAPIAQPAIGNWVEHSFFTGPYLVCRLWMSGEDGREMHSPPRDWVRHPSHVTAVPALQCRTCARTRSNDPTPNCPIGAGVVNARAAHQSDALHSGQKSRAAGFPAAMLVGGVSCRGVQSRRLEPTVLVRDGHPSPHMPRK